MAAISLDLRRRVLADCQAGHTFAAVARKYTVSAEWVRAFYRRFEQTGEVAARTHATRRQPFHVRHEAALRAAVAEAPDRTLEGLRAHLGLEVSIATLWAALHALKISFKKSLRAAEQDRPDVQERRAAWRAGQVGLDPGRLVFLDETWVKSNMTPGYGWGPTHRRVVEAVPHGHWKTITFAAALRADGLFAPVVVGGAMNGELFRAYVEQQLAPALRPGDIVVMDDLPSHKVAGVAEAVGRAGATLAYLPPYSPDLNPIEQVFAKGKAEIRRQKPRTVADTERLCGESLDWFTAGECLRYIRHAGYGPQGSD